MQTRSWLSQSRGMGHCEAVCAEAIPYLTYEEIAAISRELRGHNQIAAIGNQIASASKKRWLRNDKAGL